jgi:hypothetical protein
MSRLTAILLALCVIGAAFALHAQNRIASGGERHIIEPWNILPWTMWTSCVVWATMENDPARAATWGVETFVQSPLVSGYQTTSDKRPVASTNCLRFDGTDDYFLYPTNRGNITNFTVAMLCNMTGDGSLRNIIRHDNGGTPLWSFNYNTANRLEIFYRDAGGNSVFTNTPALSGWQVYAGRRSGGTVDIWTNGVKAVERTNASMTGNATNNAPLTVGADWNGGTVRNYFKGRMAFLVLFDRPFSDLEMTNLCNIIKNTKANRLTP